MKWLNRISRRSVLASVAALPFPMHGKTRRKSLPVGLELYSVRDQLKQDLPGTLAAVAKMGYQDVEFFSPYYEWTNPYTKQVRKILDDSGLRCLSTHNGLKSFGTGLDRSIELNQILGSKYIVMANAGRVEDIGGWQKVGETLAAASARLMPLGLKAGFHNHKTEFVPLEGQRPMEVIAKHSGKDVMLQLDVGTCVEAGVDPVSWIRENAGRIQSLHLKDWSPETGKGYEVLFGEGAVPWTRILDAAEKLGGAEFYLIEQEGSRFPALETAERCLAAFNKLRAS